MAGPAFPLQHLHLLAAPPQASFQSAWWARHTSPKSNKPCSSAPHRSAACLPARLSGSWVPGEGAQRSAPVGLPRREQETRAGEQRRSPSHPTCPLPAQTDPLGRGRPGPAGQSPQLTQHRRRRQDRQASVSVPSPEQNLREFLKTRLYAFVFPFL